MTFPRWLAVGDDFDCDDDQQRLIAVMCAINGFDLPRFDLWASALPERERLAMYERREMATKALMANHQDLALAHLEFMLVCKGRDEREQFLLPLARHADSIKKKRGKIMSKAREGRAPKHNWLTVQTLECELLASGVSPRDLAAIIEKRLKVPATTYREWRRRKQTTG